MSLGRLIISALLSAFIAWIAWSFAWLSGSPNASDAASWLACWLVFTIIFYGVGGIIAELQKIANTPRSRDDKPEDKRDDNSRKP